MPVSPELELIDVLGGEDIRMSEVFTRCNPAFSNEALAAQSLLRMYADKQIRIVGEKLDRDLTEWEVQELFRCESWKFRDDIIISLAY